MIVYRKGQSLGARSLGGVLRARWDENRADVLRRIEKRRSRRGVPLSDGEGEPELEDPGEYAGGDDLDHVMINVRALSLEQIQRHAAEFVRTGRAILAAEPGEPRRAAIAEETAAICAYLTEALVSVTGIELEDGVEAGGAPSAELFDLLGANQLLSPVFQAVDWLQSVRGDLRKNSGASRPSTSPISTATRVPSSNGRSAGVTTTHP